MKKIIAIVLTICIMLCGCSKSTETSITDVYDNNNKVSSSVSEDNLLTHYTTDKLPAECQYNATTFSIESVEYYTAKDGKSHELYVIVYLDLSKISMSDDGLDWFIEDLYYGRDSDEQILMRIKDSDISSVYLTDEENGLVSDKMLQLGSLYYSDTKKLLLIYTTSRLMEKRYSYNKCSFSITISAMQKEKTKDNFNKINSVTYNTDIGTSKIDNLESASQSLKDYIDKRMSEYVNSMYGFFGK